MNYDESEIFICNCSDISHNIVFQLWDFGKDNKSLWRPASSNCELSIHVFLNDYPYFWKRVWLGIKYIFGYKSKFGYYDTVSFRYEDATRIKAILDKFTGRVDEYTKKLDEKAKDDLLCKLE